MSELREWNIAVAAAQLAARSDDASKMEGSERIAVAAIAIVDAGVPSAWVEVGDESTLDDIAILINSELRVEALEIATSAIVASRHCQRAPSNSLTTWSVGQQEKQS